MIPFPWSAFHSTTSTFYPWSASYSLHFTSTDVGYLLLREKFLLRNFSHIYSTGEFPVKRHSGFGKSYIHRNNKSNFYSVHREEASNQRLVRLGPITCEALSERKSFQVIVKGHYTNMPPKLNRFNVGLFNKIKKQERDAVLCENTKLMNSVAEESRKLKSIQMRLKRLQAKVSNNYYKVTDFYFIY